MQQTTPALPWHAGTPGERLTRSTPERFWRASAETGLGGGRATIFGWGLRRWGVRIALALASLLALSPVAYARSEKSLAYSRNDAWATSVRFLRIDEHLKLIEKDADAGYVLFELHEDKKTFRGSLELIEVVKDGRHVIRFVVAIEDRPTWVEIGLLNRLERKLRTELGSPAPAPSPKPKNDGATKDPSNPPGNDAAPRNPRPSEPTQDPIKPETPKQDGAPPISSTP